jgi:hypothetical protein
MSSVRALANIHCMKCDGVTLHDANVCRECGTRSIASGNPPVPRPRPFGYGGMKSGQYNQARAEQGAARRRAARARHQFNQRGST